MRGIYNIEIIMKVYGSIQKLPISLIYMRGIYNIGKLEKFMVIRGYIEISPYP